uniref:Uncharacterized protein n=1 Tax=Nelumbo nucifera TaxID=4432 RepID=A0A822XZY5_NELNU|nr:TPA_asm: hypothetical protein HUJ06_026063 [Nelumbo nucifera]
MPGKGESLSLNASVTMATPENNIAEKVESSSETREEKKNLITLSMKERGESSSSYQSETMEKFKNLDISIEEISFSKDFLTIEKLKNLSILDLMEEQNKNRPRKSEQLSSRSFSP